MFSSNEILLLPYKLKISFWHFRQLLSAFIFLLFSQAATAQSPNPYNSIGKAGKIVTLTKGEYDEFFDEDSVQRIGSAFVNVNTMKVVDINLTKQEQRQLDNAHESRFLSVDPLTSKYPMLTPYQFASNTPIQAIDLDGLEAYFIHGTNSSSTRWSENKNTVPTLMRLTNNKHADVGFKWNAPITNNETDRGVAAKQLAAYAILHRVKGEEITLIGHSHGGNVAIQAADIIFKETGQKVNIITISAPAFNGGQDKENPKNHKGINDHIALWNNIDGVSGGFAGDDKFTNSPITTNVEINVGGDYTHKVSITDRFGHKSSTSTDDKIGAHSFDVDHPESIKKEMDKGKIKKLTPVK